MDAVIGVVAAIIAIVGLLAALGHGGYLLMLDSAAKRRAGGAPVASYVRSRWTTAAVTTGAGLLGLLLSLGGPFADVLAIIVGAGTAAVSAKALETTRAKFPTSR